MKVNTTHVQFVSIVITIDEIWKNWVREMTDVIQDNLEDGREVADLSVTMFRDVLDDINDTPSGLLRQFRDGLTMILLGPEAMKFVEDAHDLERKDGVERVVVTIVDNDEKVLLKLCSEDLNY